MKDEPALEKQPAPERRPRQMEQRSARAEVPAPFQPDRGAREAPAAPAASADTRGGESQMMRGPAAAGAPESRPPAAAAAPSAKPALAAPAPKLQAAPRSDDAARDSAERALASGATAKRVQEADETPERALERIAELRKSGKHDEADKALAEFRKRYPEYKLSDQMKAKVERSLAR